VQFLSSQWISALDEAAAGWAAPDGLNLVVQQIVRRPGREPVVYHLAFAAGRLRVVAGPAPDPDVTIAIDHVVAVGIASGERNAQAALAQGHLQVGGNLELFSAQARVLAGLDDLFAEVRIQTVYDAPEPGRVMDRPGSAALQTESGEIW
jgi:hypothetical protein